MLRYLTAGESHGQALTAIVEGFPSGVRVDTSVIDRELERRQGGYGRGKRQKLETDRVIIDAGIFHGETTGAPITLRLVNNDAKLERLQEPAAPRGGHIDLAGAINYQTGIRQVLERASARETAMRVAVGGLARLLLRELGIDVFGYVLELGGIAAPPLSLEIKVRDASPVYTLNPQADAAIVAAIDAAQEAGDTLGGIVETIVTGCPIGLGSHAQWDRKLDARLAAAVMSVQAIKGVEIGLGIEAARRPGSKVMDPIRYEPDHPADDRRFGFRRPTNNAGGHRRRDVQRRADRDPGGQEADQHAGRAGALGEHGDQGPEPGLVRAIRRLRGARRQRDRRGRRRLRDRRGDRREVRRHQRPGHQDGDGRDARVESQASGIVVAGGGEPAGSLMGTRGRSRPIQSSSLMLEASPSVAISRDDAMP